jgi:hypothetical protein
LQSDAEVVSDSAGYFWVKTRIDRKADYGSSNQDARTSVKIQDTTTALLSILALRR